MIYDRVVVECFIFSLSTALTGKVEEHIVDNLSSLNSVCL